MRGLLFDLENFIMQKLLSILLSISIVFSSVSPAMANGGIIKPLAGGLGSKALTTGTGKVLFEKTATELFLEQTGKQIGMGDFQPTDWLTYPPTLKFDFSTLQLDVDALVKQRIHLPTLRSMQDITSYISRPNFLATDARFVFDRIFKNPEGLSQAERNALYFDTFPSLVVARKISYPETYGMTAATNYRTFLIENYKKNFSNGNTSSLTDLLGSGKAELEQWSQTMAAVSDLGFLGLEMDSQILLNTYDAVPAALKPMTEVVIGRALINLKAYSTLQTLAERAAVNGELTNPFWAETAEYLSSVGVELNLPKMAQVPEIALPEELGTALSAANQLNAKHVDLSAKATREWVSLKENAGSAVKEPVTPSSDLPGFSVSIPKVQSVANSLNIGLTPTPMAEFGASKTQEPITPRNAPSISTFTDSYTPFPLRSPEEMGYPSLSKPSFLTSIFDSWNEWLINKRFAIQEIGSGLKLAFSRHSSRMKLGMAMLMGTPMPAPASLFPELDSAAGNTIRVEQVATTHSAVENIPSLWDIAPASAGQYASSSLTRTTMDQLAPTGLTNIPQTTNAFGFNLFSPRGITANEERMLGLGNFFKFKFQRPSFVTDYLNQMSRYHVLEGVYARYAAAQGTQVIQEEQQSPVQNVVAEENAVASSTASSGRIYSSIVPLPDFNALKGIVVNFRAYSRELSANRRAKNILSRKLPLASELRDILQSVAFSKYKKQALIALYDQGIFNSIIAELPKDTRKKIETAADYTGPDRTFLGEVLYSLYKVDTFAQALASIQVTVSFVDESRLHTLIGREEFQEQVQAVYDATPEVSPTDLSGAVEGLKEVNEKLIINSIRPPDWVAENVSSGVEGKKGWIYYRDNIPVYYRYADGTLSSQPRILLHQEPSTFYARILAKFNLSSRIGYRVPKGMVLAMDENGQFKYVRLPGHMDELESSEVASDVMGELYQKGSYHAPKLKLSRYGVSDRVAIARLLESDQTLAFQMNLDPSDSFDGLVNALGMTFGMNVDSVMVGPFKKAAMASDSPVTQTVVPNAFGGFGYVTPRVGARFLPLIQKWGVGRGIFSMLTLMFGAVAYSWASGINGITKVEGNFSLLQLAVPMLVLVAGASILRSVSSIILNHYKDPQVRTAANLRMSTYQQGSRFGLAALTALFPLLGTGNAFVAVPAATILMGITLALLLNTSMGKEVFSSVKSTLQKPSTIFKNLWSGIKHAGPALGIGFVEGVLTPGLDLFNAAKRKIFRIKPTYSDDVAGLHRQRYDNEFRTQAETKASLTRVSLAYASYAVSIMLLNQLLAGALDSDFLAQLMTATFAAASWGVRFMSKRWVEKGKFTDDQLTGISFMALGTMPFLLAALPYEGAWLIPVIASGILLNMGTAVPGQLDNTRLQNNVTASIQSLRNQIMQDKSLSAEDRQVKLADLTVMEEKWAGWAAADYSSANARGTYGIMFAILVSALASGWLIDVTSAWQEIMYRTIFTYAGAVAAVGAWTTREQAKSFLRSLFKRKSSVQVTPQNIQDGTVSAKTFNIPTDEKKAFGMLTDLVKGKKGSLKALTTQLNPNGGVSMASEVKMTNVLIRMTQIHNRLVGLSEVLGGEAVREGFNELYTLAGEYEKVLTEKSGHFSESLNREFSALLNGLCVGGQTQNGLKAIPTYIAEGGFGQLAHYGDFMRAKDLVMELETLAGNILNNSNAVKNTTFSTFVKYHNEARDLLQDYMVSNPAEAGFVGQEEAKIRQICRQLKEADTKGILQQNAGNTSPDDIQLLRDILQAY